MKVVPYGRAILNQQLFPIPSLLCQAGAELVYFSPLTDPLPADVAGIYLGGGYPERCAAQPASACLLVCSPSDQPCDQPDSCSGSMQGKNGPGCCTSTA